MDIYKILTYVSWFVGIIFFMMSLNFEAIYCILTAILVQLMAMESPRNGNDHKPVMNEVKDID